MVSSFAGRMVCGPASCGLGMPKRRLDMSFGASRCWQVLVALLERGTGIAVAGPFAGG